LESALYLWEQISAPRNTASKRTSRVFTCFPKLPTEIRLAIWDLASRTTRNLDVMQNIQGQECRYYYVRYSSKAPVPSILHTSHESRMAALKHYTLAFPFIVSPGVASKETKTSGIYVNWEYDCICPMNLENIPDHFRFAQKLSGIRKIALNVDLINVRAISIYCIDTVDEIILYPGRSFYEDVYSDNLRCLFPVMDIQFAGLAINGGDIPQSSTSLWALRELGKSYPIPNDTTYPVRSW